jgi:hypothetical protein
MNFREWKKSNADYSRRLVNSGLEGARSGREAFLSGRPLTPFLNESARHAVTAAALGAGIGLLGGFSANRHRSAGRALAFGVFGGALGFGAGVAWESRRLGASVVSGAMKNIGRVRDEHWLEKNPIDYA